jgi:hypothetical protein
LVGHPEVAPHLRGYDSDALTWRWDFAHLETEVLHKELEAIAASASDCGQEAVATLEEMRVALTRATGRNLPSLGSPALGPRLTESWFCCAEPTNRQAVSISRR